MMTQKTDAGRRCEIHCPVEATINLIGGKYKSLILWKLMSGTLRFPPCAGKFRTRRQKC